MKWLLFFALLSGLAAAQLYVPPVEDVMAANDALGPALENSYDNSTANSSSVTLPFYQSPLSVKGSVNIAGMSLLLDNATYPEDGLSLLIARGAREDHLWALGNPAFICNYSSFNTDPHRCDFDTDGCPEYEKSVQATYGGNAVFNFRNSAYTIPFTSTIIPLTPELLAQMKNSSGAEVLEVTVSGIIVFTYLINNQSACSSGCCDAPYYVTRNVYFSATRNFSVFGTNKLYFLRAPVLREQWFRNNRFDTIILSQSPLYHADIWLNGNRTRNLTLRTFDVSTGPYGVEEITSNRSKPDGWSEDVNLTTPTLLDSYGHSFNYIYTFNYSYDGLGQNALSLVVNDSFLGSARYDEVLNSRMLSYNGASAENGSPASSVPSRPSAVFSQDYMSSFEIVLGLLAMIFILSFVNFWLLK